MKKLALAFAACILALMPLGHGSHHDDPSDGGASTQRIDWD